MPIDVRMPDGTLVKNVPDNITQADLAARFDAFKAQVSTPVDSVTPQAPVTGPEGAPIPPILQTQEKPKIETASPLEALVGSTKRMASDVMTGAQLPFDANKATIEGMARQEGITEKSATSLEAVKQAYEKEGFLPAAKEVATQVPGFFTEQVPLIGSMAAGARTGYFFGGPYGALAGSVLLPLLAYSGSSAERKAAEQIARGEKVDIDASGAFASGAGMAALDRLSFGLSGLSKLFGISAKQFGTQSANKIARESIGTAIAKGTIKTELAELPTEIAQQAIERYYAGLSLTDADALKEYGEIAYATSLMGPLGGAARLQERSQAKKATTPTPPPVSERIEPEVTPREPVVEVGQPTIVPSPELEAYDKEIAKAQPTETKVSETSHDTQAMMDELSGKSVEYIPEEEDKVAESPKTTPKGELPVGSKVSWNDDGNQVESTILDSMSKAGITMYKVTSTDASKPNGVWVESSNLQPIGTPKEEVKPEVLYSAPMGENTEYHVLKNDQGYIANLYDKDAEKYISGSGRIFPEKTFGIHAETAAKNFVKFEQEKAAPYSPEIKPKEEPTGVISETEKEFTPVGGRLISKADADKLTRESAIALEQNLKNQEIQRDKQIRREIREDKFPAAETPSLASALKALGGINVSNKLDMLKDTGKVFNYESAFSKDGEDLLTHIENGSLDEYLPHQLRLSNTPPNEAFDPRPAYDYISSVIESKQKVHDYDYELAKIDHKNKIREKYLAKQYMEPNEAAQAAAAEIQGKEYMNVEPSKEVIPTPSETKFHEDAKTYVSEVPDWYFTDQAPSFKIEMNKLRRRIKQGFIKQEDVIPEIESIYQATKKERPILDRQRGAAIIKEKLLAAKRRKELSPEMVDMAEWFINQNPDLVQDLAVSIRSNNRDGVAGGYLPLSKLAKIFKYSPNDMTAVHEMLHHMERMLPTDVQDAIRKAWSKSLQKDSERAFGGKNETLKEYYKNVIDYHTKGKKEYEDKAMQMLADNVIPYEHYKNFNPSEFWATKGSEIVQGRYKADISDSIVAKIKNWLKEFIETVKGIFNISDDAAVIKALNSLAKSDGKFVTDMIHADTEAYNIEKPEEDVGYHSGDLGFGKDTAMGRMGGRSTGHFGTGVYFVSDPKLVKGYKGRDQVQKVDFSKYKLAKPGDRESAFNLHDGLKFVNNAFEAYAEGIEEWPGHFGQTYSVKKFIKDGALKIWSGIHAEDANKKYVSMDRVEQIIKDEIEKAKPQYEKVLHTNEYVPSVSTEVMKSLGYQGVDVRGISDLDNTWGGSVIYEKSLADKGKPVEKEYLSIGQPPKNIKGQEVIPQWESPDPESKLDLWIYRLQNKQIDTKRVQQAIGEIEDNWNVYEKEQLYHGRTASGIRNFLLKELLPIIKEIERLKIDPEEVRTYLHNRHAEERNIQMNKINPGEYDPKTNTFKPSKLKDKASGIHTDIAREYLSNLDPDKKKTLEKVAAKFDQMVRGTQQILINSGAESSDTIAQWNKTYKHYVPLFRVEDEMAKPSGLSGTGQGFGTRGDTSKRAMGSEKEVQDILSNIIAQRERALIRAEKIRVGRAIYGLAIQNPNPDFWLPINPDAIRNKKQAVAELARMGIPDAKDMIDNLMAEPKERYLKKVQVAEGGVEPEEEFDFDSGLPVNQSKEVVAAKVNVMSRYKDYVFPIRIDGKDRYVFFNQKDPRALRMVQSLKNLDVENLGWAIGLAGKATRWFKSVNTQYNPVFGLINFLRDFGGTLLNLTNTEIKGKQAQVIAGSYKAMAGILNVHRAERKGKAPSTGPWATLYQEYRDEGTQTGYRDSLIRNQEEMQIIEHTLAQFKDGNTKKAFYAVLGGLTDYNDMMENAFRLSAYKVALDQGLSKQKAAIIAKNLTVNFDRKGAWTASANALYAFFNASVQGTERIYQTLKGPKGKMIIGGGILAGMVQAVMLAAAGYDEDDPPEFVREKNFIIPLADGTYFTIPYPLGYNVLPSSGRIVMEFMLHGGKNPGKHVASLTSAIVNSVNPLGSSGFATQTLMPTVIDPLVALGENKDSFGRPISRKDRATAPTPGYSRSRETSTALGKGIAEFLNWASGGDKYVKGSISPTGDDVDFLAGQIGGGLYREISKAAKAVGSTITGEEIPAYRRPIVGRFIGETGSNAAISQTFYENVTRLTDHENTIKGLKKDKLPTDSYKAKHPEARLWPRANSAENQINAINKDKREAIAKNKPKEVIQRLDEKKARIMKKFNDEVKQANAD
jgi:hypothetical protein